MAEVAERETEGAAERAPTPGDGYYESLRIDGFRGFERFELCGMSRVNVFLGPNNCGKTSLLEAVYTHACGLNVAPFLRQVVLGRQGGQPRGPYDFGEKLRSVFRVTSSRTYSAEVVAAMAGGTAEHVTRLGFAPAEGLAGLDPVVLGAQTTASSAGWPVVPTTAVDLGGEGDVARAQVSHGSPSLGSLTVTAPGRGRMTVDLRFPLAAPPPTPPFRIAVMHDILDHRSPDAEATTYSALKRSGAVEEFAERLADVFPEVRGIDMIPYPDGSAGPVYATTGGANRLPLWALGDGVRRWLYLLGQMLVHRNAVHCIEEVDATFHPATRRQLSSLLVRYALQYGNQLFLTTHSIEFADAFLEALYGEEGELAGQDEDPVRLFTLRPEEGRTTPAVWMLTGREAYAKRRDYALELR